MSKILKIIFVILLLVTAGELGYYVYFQAVRTPREEKKQTTSSSPIPTLFLKEIKNNPNAVSIKSVGDEIQYLKEMHEDGVLLSSAVNTQYKGSIIKIERKEGIVPYNNFKYSAIIVLRGKQKNFDFVLSEEELRLSKIYKIVNGEEKEISFDDLKVGDSISLDWSFGAYVGFNSRHTKQIKIIKQ